VFVNLWGGRRGRPLTYATVDKLIARIRSGTGIEFSAHMLRHTHATDLVRRGVPIEVVARLLTHRSSRTTSETYVHLETVDIRRALHAAGVWHDDEAGDR
jgi:integrase/recombinase XerD